MVTHYTSRFDDNGRPIAITIDFDGDDRAAGVLPEGWDDTFWDWQPRFDPSGQWVQLVDLKRDALWALVKQEREVALLGGYPTSKGVLQVDRASLEQLRARLMRAQLPDQPLIINWTMADNSIAEFTPSEFAVLMEGVEDWIDAVHAWSQELRKEIFNQAVQTLEALNLIPITGSYPKP